MGCTLNPNGPEWAADAPSSNPGDIVEQGFTDSRSYSLTSFLTALAAIRELETALDGMTLENFTVDDSDIDFSGIDLEDTRPPGDADITPNFDENAPEDNGRLAVDNFDITPAPTYEGGQPEINEITAPTKFVGVKPTIPGNTDLLYPTVAERDLPDVPTLRDLTLPDAPDLVQVEFDGILPGILDDAPDVSFSFTEPGYQSDLLDQLKTKLLALTSDLTIGLGDEVVQQLWDQNRDRTEQEAQRGVTNITRRWSASGWDQPGGDLVEAIAEQEQNVININVTDSRMVAIEEARLKQANFQFAITSAIGLETTLINWHNQIAQRAFEAAKFSIEAAVQVYGMLVSQYNARVQAYLAQAEVFKARIQAQLAEVEKFKAQIDAQRLIGELNQQDVAIYREQVQAVDIIYGLYVKELEGTKVQLEERRVDIDKLAEQVKLYGEEAKAHALEYDKYKTEVEAEEIKAKTYDTRANIHRALVDAWSVYERTRIDKLNSDIKLNQEIPVEVFKTLTEAFQIKNESEASRIRALADVHQSDVQAYAEEVRAKATELQAKVDKIQAEVAVYTAETGAKTEAAKARSAQSIAQAEIVTGALQAIATTASQVAAAAMSAVNLSAQASESQSFGLSYGERVNVNFSCDD